MFKICQAHIQGLGLACQQVDSETPPFFFFGQSTFSYQSVRLEKFQRICVCKLKISGEHQGSLDWIMQSWKKKGLRGCILLNSGISLVWDPINGLGRECFFLFVCLFVCFLFYFVLFWFVFLSAGTFYGPELKWNWYEQMKKKMMKI